MLKVPRVFRPLDTAEKVIITILTLTFITFIIVSSIN